MKYIKNQKSVITAVITTALMLFCFGMLLFNPEQTQFITTGIILIPIAANSWLPVFMEPGESKSKSKFSGIVNTVLDIGCLICFLIYGLLRDNLYLYISLILSLLLVINVIITIVIYVKNESSSQK